MAITMGIEVGGDLIQSKMVQKGGFYIPVIPAFAGMTKF